VDQANGVRPGQLAFRRRHDGVDSQESIVTAIVVTVCVNRWQRPDSPCAGRIEKKCSRRLCFFGRGTLQPVRPSDEQQTT